MRATIASLQQVRRRAALAMAAAAAGGAVLAACTAPSAQAPAAAHSTGVTSLTRIGMLRSAFNHDDGHPRLLLVFSPT